MVLTRFIAVPVAKWREEHKLVGLVAKWRPTWGKTARGTASILSPLFGLLHPALQHRLNLLCALWCDVQLLEPAVGSGIREEVCRELDPGSDRSMGLCKPVITQKKRN